MMFEIVQFKNITQIVIINEKVQFFHWLLQRWQSNTWTNLFTKSLYYICHQLHLSTVKRGNC